MKCKVKDQERGVMLKYNCSMRKMWKFRASGKLESAFVKVWK